MSECRRRGSKVLWELEWEREKASWRKWAEQDFHKNVLQIEGIGPVKLFVRDLKLTRKM